MTTRATSPNAWHWGRTFALDILSYQIMLDQLHLLVDYIKYTSATTYPERTLEIMRSVGGKNILPRKTGSITSERTFSKVRSQIKHEYTISDLMQLIKGNFSRKIHQDNIWQKRFYARIITNQKYLATVIEYLKQNPIKENLPAKYHQFLYQYFDWNKINTLF